MRIKLHIIKSWYYSVSLIYKSCSITPIYPLFHEIVTPSDPNEYTIYSKQVNNNYYNKTGEVYTVYKQPAVVTLSVQYTGTRLLYWIYSQNNCFHFSLHCVLATCCGDLILSAQYTGTWLLYWKYRIYGQNNWFHLLLKWCVL